MSQEFFWFPILQKLQGKKVPWDGVLGFIEKGIWIESYDEKIFAFTDDFKNRHAISLKEAKIIYNSESQVFQPTLFEM